MAPFSVLSVVYRALYGVGSLHFLKLYTTDLPELGKSVIPVKCLHVFTIMFYFDSYQRILAFHDKYGEVVRLGPELISVAGKDLLKQVLITDDFPKGKLYDAFQSKFDLTVHNFISYNSPPPKFVNYK